MFNIQCLTSTESSTWGRLLGSRVKCLSAAGDDLATPIGGSCTQYSFLDMDYLFKMPLGSKATKAKRAVNILLELD